MKQIDSFIHSFTDFFIQQLECQPKTQTSVLETSCYGGDNVVVESNGTLNRTLKVI